ncbi:hypothetical protein MMC29_006598 [Sticta canariensis]|nr:hypothetical protein [Sticta canariensis]
MGTEGYRVTRFRGRYYRFYRGKDSYPEGLGRWIVSEIPTDPEAYQQWLAEQRKEALGWHLAVERYLCRERADYEVNEDVDEDASGLDDRESSTGNEHWGIGIPTETLPAFTPPLNDLCIEWVYTIDLDNEVFTVDNGAHLHLDRIPRDAWINALARGYHGDRIFLPKTLPEEAIANLVVRLPSPTLDMLKSLDISIVVAKGLDGFSPARRHGPLVRARIFHFFQNAFEPILSALLLSWRTNELPFREIAYALLCVASGSPNLSFVPVQQLSHKIGYTDLTSTNREREKAEFLAHLGVGCHLEGLPPGSSPDSEMYWLDGALVCLAGQTQNCPEVLDGALVRVVEYCRSQRPNQCVNAILMSIQDIVLMRIYSGGRVERTEVLPLFDILTHTSMNSSGRYEVDYLEKMQVRKEKFIKRQEWLRQQYLNKNTGVEEELPSEQLNPDKEEDEENEEEEGNEEFDKLTRWPREHFQRQAIEDDSEAAFLALTYFLEVSSRQQMPPSRAKEGVFPTEIYGMILRHLEDLQTHHACMQVSRSFRDLCQQKSMIMDGVVVQAVTTSPTSAWARGLRIKTLSTGQSHDVTLKQMPLQTPRSSYLRGPEKQPESRWQVVLGSERNRRSILPHLAVGFTRSESGNESVTSRHGTKALHLKKSRTYMVER